MLFLSSTRDLFVRGLADRVADCCKCIVLVPQLDPPPSFPPEAEEERALARSGRPSDEEVAAPEATDNSEEVPLPASSLCPSPSSGCPPPAVAVACPTSNYSDSSSVSPSGRSSLSSAGPSNRPPPSPVTQAHPSASLHPTRVLQLAYSFITTQIVHRSLHFLKREFALDSLAVMGVGPGGGRALETVSFLSLLRREKRKLFGSKGVVAPQSDLGQLERTVFSTGEETANSRPPHSLPPPFQSRKTDGDRSDAASEEQSRPLIPPFLLEGGLFSSCISPVFAPELLIPDAVVALYPSGYRPAFVGGHIDVPTLAIFAGGDTGVVEKKGQQEGVEDATKSEEKEIGETLSSSQRNSQRENFEGSGATPVTCRKGFEGATELERALREHDSKFNRDFLIRVVENVRTGFAHRFWDDKTRQVVTDRQVCLQHGGGFAFLSLRPKCEGRCRS